MKWAKRKKEIARLRARYAGSTFGAPFPDLTCDKPGLAPCSNILQYYTPPRPKPIPRTPHLIVDHFHKSGLQVILPSELPWAGGRKP